MAAIRIVTGRSVVFTCFLFSLWTFPSIAQVEKKPVHNGQLKASGSYNVEVVNCYGYLEIYLYNRDMQPLFNGGITGYVNFSYTDGSKSSSKVYSYGIDAFTATPEKDNFSGCEVVLKRRSVSIHVAFKDLVCVRPGD